jgi:hypothetical protein
VLEENQQLKENLMFILARTRTCMLPLFVLGKIVPGGRKKKMGGGSISQERKMVSNYKQGGVAKGCGAVLENRRKVTKKY